MAGVSLKVGPGETVALVGESGCGKSTLARVLTGLIAPSTGSVLFEGRDLWGFDRKERAYFRRSVQMIFQDPYGSLNPRMRVGDAIGEPLTIHGLAAKNEMAGRVAGLMENVGLDPALGRRYPREFSGGQRQRIGIARALAAGPRLLIADEPVSALDVSIQAQVLNLLADLRDEKGLSMLFISHDLRVVAKIADRLAVMYLGKIVEEGDAEEFFTGPRHPYSRLLLKSVPKAEPEEKAEQVVLKGDPPSPTRTYEGCPFAERCPERLPKCEKSPPPWTGTPGGARVACHLYG